MSGLQFVARATATAVTNAPTVLLQATPSSASPITLNRFKLQSNVISSSQAIVQVQYVFYATGTGSGTTITPVALTKRMTVASNTAFRSFTTTMGTTPTVIAEFQWNTAMPWEDVLGMDSLKIDVNASQAFAVILPAASGTPTLSMTLEYTEY